MFSFRPFPSPPSDTGIAEAFRDRAARVSWLARVDWAMVPMGLFAGCGVLLMLVPIEQPWFIALASIAWVMDFARVVFPALLITGIAVAAQSFMLLRKGRGRVAGRLSICFGWFDVHGELAKDLSLAGVSGREIAELLYHEGVRMWRPVVNLAAGTLVALILGLLAGTWQLLGTLATVEIFALSVPVVVGFGLHLATLKQALGLLELDSRYYAWMKVAEPARYHKQSAFFGIIAAVLTIVLVAPFLLQVRVIVSQWIGLLITHRTDPELFRGTVAFLALCGGVLCILWPIARQLSAVLVHRRIRRMDEYFAKLVDVLHEKQ